MNDKKIDDIRARSGFVDVTFFSREGLLGLLHFKHADIAYLLKLIKELEDEVKTLQGCRMNFDQLPAKLAAGLRNRGK